MGPVPDRTGVGSDRRQIGYLAGPGGDDAAKVLVVDCVGNQAVVERGGGGVGRRRQTVWNWSDDVGGRRRRRRRRVSTVVYHTDTTVLTDSIRHLHSTS